MEGGMVHLIGYFFSLAAGVTYGVGDAAVKTALKRRREDSIRRVKADETLRDRIRNRGALHDEIRRVAVDTARRLKNHPSGRSGDGSDLPVITKEEIALFKLLLDETFQKEWTN